LLLISYRIVRKIEIIFGAKEKGRKITKFK
jgi:hypothetical protein